MQHTYRAFSESLYVFPKIVHLYTIFRGGCGSRRYCTPQDPVLCPRPKCGWADLPESHFAVSVGNVHMYSMIIVLNIYVI